MKNLFTSLEIMETFEVANLGGAFCMHFQISFKIVTASMKFRIVSYNKDDMYMYKNAPSAASV